MTTRTPAPTVAPPVADHSTALGVLVAGALALTAAAGAAYLGGAIAIGALGHGNTGLIAGAVAAGIALVPLALIPRVFVSTLSARLRMFAELATLSALVLTVVAPSTTLSAVRARPVWPAELVGRAAAAAPVARVMKSVLGDDDATATATASATVATHAAVATGAAAHTAKLSPKEIFARAAPSVVVIDVEAGIDDKSPLAPFAKAMGLDSVHELGSGFFVGPNLVVTNDHVAGSARSMRVRSKENGTVSLVRVLALDPRNDLALLEVVLPVSPLALGPNADVGDDAVAIGAPLGLDYTLTSGLVSQRRTLDGTHFLQVQTTIAPGSSGGPLLDDHARVIGVNTATRGAGLNLAVDVAHVQALLQMPREPKALSRYADDGVALTSLEIAGPQPLPTQRAAIASAMALYGGAVASCVPSGDAEVSFDADGAVRGLEGDQQECVAKKTARLGPAFGEPITARFVVPTARHLVIHVRERTNASP